MLPIDLLALLYFTNLRLLRRQFPQFVHENSRVLEDSYDHVVYQPYYGEVLAKASLSFFLCLQLMNIRVGEFSFSQKVKSQFVQFMMQRIIFSGRFNLNQSFDSCTKINRVIPMNWYSTSLHGRTDAVDFHEMIPIMAVCTYTCRIYRIQKDLSTFEEVSVFFAAGQHTSFLSACFHRRLPILALGGYDGIVYICSMNLDGTKAMIFYTFPIREGPIWSLVFHPTLPILFVSTARTGNVVILHFTKNFQRFQSEQKVRIHVDTINSINIQKKKSHFLLTTSDDYTAHISIPDSDSNFQVWVPTSVLRHDHKVLSGAIHPYFHLVATGSDDNYATIWNVSDINNPRRIIQLNHSAGVGCLHFGFGFTLLTGSYSGSVSLWNIEDEGVISDRPIFTISGPPRNILSFGVNPNDPTNIVVGNSQEVISYKLE